jgi:hypothetical protein
MTSRNQRKALSSDVSCIATRNSSIKELISYFMSTIKDIVREVLGGTNDQDVLWRAAEACYEQPFVPMEACVLMIILIHSKRPVWHGHMTPTSIVKDITSTNVVVYLHCS